MSNDRGRRADEQLRTLQAEIERWNTQINLVSRVKTRGLIEDLTAQCRSGWSLTREALARSSWPETSLHVDLGSGGGFPGLVWASERWRAGQVGPTVLVEPRDKRAWFLRRTARAMGLAEVFVWQARWGDAPEAIEFGSETILISVKALRIDDEEILQGVSTGFEAMGLPGEVAIVRFLDPSPHDPDWLEEQNAAHGAQAGQVWLQTGVEILGEGDPGLLLTRYSLR